MKLTKLGWITMSLLVIITIGWAYMLTGFKPHKCNHIFVEEQVLFVDGSYLSTEEFSRKAFLDTYKLHNLDELNVEGRVVPIEDVISGKRIVCIKCLWQTRQIVYPESTLRYYNENTDTGYHVLTDEIIDSFEYVIIDGKKGIEVGHIDKSNKKLQDNHTERMGLIDSQESWTTKPAKGVDSVWEELVKRVDFMRVNTVTDNQWGNWPPKRLLTIEIDSTSGVLYVKDSTKVIRK